MLRVKVFPKSVIVVVPALLLALVSVLGNPPITFIFQNQTHGDTKGEIKVTSPDPGRALIAGIADDAVDGKFDSLDAFKISPLRGIRHTAPYFYDNSAKTLEAVAAHYAIFFAIVTDPDGQGPLGPLVELTPQDEADIVAFMKLL